MNANLLARQIINNVNGNSCVGNRESLDSFFRKEKADFVKADIPLLERVGKFIPDICTPHFA